MPAVVVLGKATAGQRTDVTSASSGLPSALTVIERDEIATINVGKDISNMFRRVPGVMANSIDQGDTGNGFRMRGFTTQGTHGADTAVYVDGVPQNMPSSEAGAGHGPAFLEWLTADMIERIEVIKGPVSALYGDQNRAGAVNIETTREAARPSVGISIESYGGRRASLSAAGKLGAVQSVLIADLYRTDSHRQGASTERDNLLWKLSTHYAGGLYSLRLNHYSSDFTAAGYLRYERLASGTLERSAAEENALPSFGGGKRTALVLNRAPASGEAGWHATAYAEDFSRVRGASAGGAAHNVGSDQRTIAGGRLAYNLVFGENAALHAGVDVRRDSGDGIRQRYANRVPTVNYLTNLDLDLLTWGVFAQAQYKPAVSLKLLAGLRADRFDYDIGNRKLPAASGDYRDTVLTPKLGAAWSVAPALELFSNMAQGFRSPAAQQISPGGSLGPLGQGGGVFNEAVAASKVRSFDLGFRSDPLPGWSASGALFHTVNDDEIVSTAPDVFRSVGNTTRRGFELESRLRLTGGLSAYGSYARLLTAKINNPAPNSADLLSVPRHQLKAGLEYRQALGAATVAYHADAYLTSGIPYFSGAPLARREMPTYTRYDLRVSYAASGYQLAAFAVFQPHLISEAAYATAAGLFVSPQPHSHLGASVRYFF